MRLHPIRTRGRSRAEVAEQLAAYGDAGAARVVASFAVGDWFRQAELLAQVAHRR
jgi:hypothetical protein